MTYLPFFLLLSLSLSPVDGPPIKAGTFSALLQQAARSALGSEGSIFVTGNDLNGFPTSIGLQSDPSRRTSFDSALPFFIQQVCSSSPPSSSTPSSSTPKPVITTPPNIPPVADLVCFSRGQVQAMAGSGVASFLLNLLWLSLSFLLGCKFRAIVSPTSISLVIERDPASQPSRLMRAALWLLSFRSTSSASQDQPEPPVNLVDLEAAAERTYNPLFDFPPAPDVEAAPTTPEQEGNPQNFNPHNPFIHM